MSNNNHWSEQPKELKTDNVNGTKDLIREKEKTDLDFFLKSEVSKDFDTGYGLLNLLSFISYSLSCIAIIISFTTSNAYSIAVSTSINLFMILLTYVVSKSIKANFLLRDMTYLKIKSEL